MSHIQSSRRPLCLSPRATGVFGGLAVLALATACPGGLTPDVTCFAGDFVVNRSDEVTSLQTTRCVTGNLVLAVEDIEDISAPFLESVEGDLVVVGTSAPVLDLGALTTVEGSVLVQANPNLLLANFDQLTTVGGDIVVNGNPLLSTLSVEQLPRVGGDLTVGGNGRLANLDFSALEETGGSFSILENPLLAAATVGELSAVGGSFVLRSPALNAFSIETLRTVERSFVVENTPLATLDLSQVESVKGPFRVINSAVPSIALGDSVRLSSVELRNLEALESLDFLSGRVAEDMESIWIDNLPIVSGDADAFADVQSVRLLQMRNNPELASLEFASLRSAASVDLYLTGRHVDLGALESVDNSLSLVARTCALDQLETVGQAFTLSMVVADGSPAPTTCGAPQLNSVGGRFFANPFPEETFTALQSVGSLNLLGPLYGTPVSTRTLPALEEVTGQLVIRGYVLASFPRLTDVGSLFVTDTEAVDLPNLDAMQLLSVDRLSDTARIDAPNLLELDQFFVSYCPIPDGLVVQTVAQMNISGVDLDQLGFVSEMTTWGNASFSDMLGETAAFPNVTEATGMVDFRWSDAVVALELPNLVSVGEPGFFIQGLQGIATVDLSALQTTPAFTFSYTINFDTCTIAPLIARLVENGTDPDRIWVDGFDPEACD